MSTLRTERIEAFPNVDANVPESLCLAYQVLD